MFFKAFSAIEGSHLPLQLTFDIEHQASQVLACSHIDALEHALEEQDLINSLFSEVEFLGTIPHDMQEEVRAYFQNHERILYETAQQLIDQPEDEELRNEVRQPLQSEDELRGTLFGKTLELGFGEHPSGIFFADCNVCAHRWGTSSARPSNVF